ncbi:hypothetical protein S40293_06492 [Stachybotrys chartarum IBT 40293]|nr:hypothetical protein S40293_06492 [Stachybotrys chartarum IBT 40293]
MSMYASINGSSRKKVAIVGSGSAGIAALWALNRTYHDVYLYEAADRLGGQTNTVQWKTGKYTATVDAGFICMNAATSPNFTKFLNRLGVPLETTEISLAVSRDYGLFEWAAASWSTVFCQWKSLFSPRVWRMLFDIARFNQFALDVLIKDDNVHTQNDLSNGTGSKMETIGQYLEREDYSDGFRDDYLLPIMAALWSTSPSKSNLDFPAATLIRSLYAFASSPSRKVLTGSSWNYDMLSTTRSRRRWVTLKDGAQAYITAVMKGFPPNHLFLKTPVRYVTSIAGGRVMLQLENGRSEEYDHVILACHGDEALSIIKPSATAEERSILSCFQTSQTEAVLHSDASVMPRNRKAWSSWNYLATTSRPKKKIHVDQACLTYNLNTLQRIPRNPFGDVLLTLNPLYRPRPDQTRGRYFYSRSLFTPSAVRAQARLQDIQNQRGISYAGAWTKNGLHEDGFSSGLYAAQEYLGAKLPFEYTDPTYIRGKTPVLGLTDHLLRLIILIIQVFVIQLGTRLATFRWKRAPPLTNGVGNKHLNGKYM